MVVDLALVGSRLAAEVELVRKTAVEEQILVMGPTLGNLDFVRMEQAAGMGNLPNVALDLDRNGPGGAERS